MAEGSNSERRNVTWERNLRSSRACWRDISFLQFYIIVYKENSDEVERP